MWEYIFVLKCAQLDEKHLADRLEQWNRGLHPDKLARISHRSLPGKLDQYEAKLQLASPATVNNLVNFFFTGPEGKAPSILKSHSPSLIPICF